MKLPKDKHEEPGLSQYGLDYAELGLSHKGHDFFNELDYQTPFYDPIFDARGGKGGTDSGTGGGKGGKPTKGSTTDTTTTDSLPNVYVSGDSAVDDSQEFNIRIDFTGTYWTDALKEDFITAADFLSDVITGDIAPAGYDDITISASLLNIDGKGGVLGQAGPTYIWTDNYLTSAGIMEFDISDAENYDSAGLWDDIVLHEMIHTLGFGTLWDYHGLTTQEVDSSGNVNYVYHGEMANAYSNALFGTDLVVEADGGSGTAGGHLDESVYGNELMTGYINGDNYLSQVTYAGLVDLGYEVSSDYLLV